jgi:16S rRNA (cytosine967-C5)-methyltransferase
MRDGGRLQAAIEILSDIESRRRPASDALKDWGLDHRFAGSGDRSAIGNLVHDALRRRRSLAALAGADAPRAAVLAAFAILWDKGLAGLDAALADPHAPEKLTQNERKRLETLVSTGDTDQLLSAEGASDAVRADLPDWLMPSFSRLFADPVAEGRALAMRAPVDLRVNTLKAERGPILTALAPLGAEPTPLSPLGIRLPARAGAARAPHVESEPEFLSGQIEIQDEGSQLAALVAGARPGETVLDLCAGGGGKTLALGAAMANTGRLSAYDADKRRLRDLYERSARAGVGNLTILTPDRGSPLADLAGSQDLVLIDAPCTGTGTWRRRPDAKWRLSEKALATRQADQDAVLMTGAAVAKPGGRLVYITCSLLAEENEDRVAAFLQAAPGFAAADPLARLDAGLAAKLRPFVRSDRAGFSVLRLTPAGAGTDGFFVAVLEKRR